MEILTERDAKVLCSNEAFMPRPQRDHTTPLCTLVSDQLIAAFTHEGDLLKECFFISDTDSIPNKTYQPSVESVLKVEYLDEIFLAHTNQWSDNFQHFLIELLPKLMNYRKNILGVKLMPSPQSENNLFLDICNLIGIPKDIILFPQWETCYDVKSLRFCGYEENMHCTEYTLNAL